MAGGCQVAYASAGRLAFLFLDGLNVEGLYHQSGVCVCVCIFWDSKLRAYIMKWVCVCVFWIDSMLRAYIMEVGWLCERDVAEGRLTVQLQKPLQRYLVKDHMEFVTGSQN